MSLLLIRHGETALNVARVLQPADTPLSERGLAQAQALARRLAQMDIAAIISSDLPRALRTAQAIVAATGAPIETTALLHERNFGDWRGRPYDAMAIDPLTMRGAPPGGESMRAFARRVAQAFAHIAARRAAIGGNVVVVSHGMVIREMLATQVGVASHNLPGHLGNTGLSILDAAAPHACTLMNCTLHLDTATRDAERALSGG